MNLSLLLLVIIGIVSADLVEDNFGHWVEVYGKSYDSEAEYDYRLGVYRSNFAVIDSLNQREGKTIYGITKFMDLTPEEFSQKYLIPEGKVVKKEKPMVPLPEATDIPVRFDWNEKKAVTPVYDQGQCGSCWAFSATEAIESQWFLAGHSLVSLSPQQIVDCDKGRGDEGCNGGDTPTAYQYVMSAGGMDTMAAYPYTAEDDPCAFKASGIAATIKDWTYITQNKNETEMQLKLLAVGPLSICVDATIWQFYIGGVISDFCGTSLDHCVLITGYDDAYEDWGESLQIWKIRNSWGADWGESGYVYVERGYDLCGVADEVTIPIV
jgi:cathepsin F